MKVVDAARAVCLDAHTALDVEPSLFDERRYFTSNCVVMPCMLCGLPSFASGRKQIMP